MLKDYLERRLVATSVAALVIGFSPETLKQWRSKGTGPVYRKVGRSVRYELKALYAWQREQRSVSASAPNGE